MPHSQDKTFTQIHRVLCRYGFEINKLPIAQQIKDWSAHYPVYWIRLGIIEALYQGRYKVISIENILRLWQRRGEATYHFTSDFERLITEKLVIDDWTDTDNEGSITQFSPHPDPSELYDKLRAVAHQQC